MTASQGNAVLAPAAAFKGLAGRIPGRRAECRGQQVGNDRGEPGRAAPGLHDADIVVGHVFAGATQAGADDADHVERRQTAAGKALDQRAEIGGGVDRLQFRQRAERQAEFDQGLPSSSAEISPRRRFALMASP